MYIYIYSHTHWLARRLSSEPFNCPPSLSLVHVTKYCKYAVNVPPALATPARDARRRHFG